MEKPEVVQIEEVAIAVKEPDKAAAYFKELFGMDFPLSWQIPHEKIKVRSEKISGTQLQFIGATDPEGVVDRFIKEKGEGLNHIALRVTQIEEMVKQLKAKGVKFIPDRVVEVENKDIPLGGSKAYYIFIHPKSAYGVLIELIEIK